MPIFQIKFQKVVETTVEADDLDSVRAAAEEAADYDLHDWCLPEWNVDVFQIPASWPQAKGPAECALLDGEIVNRGDVE